MTDDEALPEASRTLRTGMADAVMHEVAERLGALIATGEPGLIALHALPLSDIDRSELEERLGRGEVFATLAVAGESEIWETSFPAVWWIRHRGSDGRIAVEEIEVTHVPHILVAQIEDVRAGMHRLDEVLLASTTGQSADGGPFHNGMPPSAGQSSRTGDIA